MRSQLLSHWGVPNKVISDLHSNHVPVRGNSSCEREVSSLSSVQGRSVIYHRIIVVRFIFIFSIFSSRSCCFFGKKFTWESWANLLFLLPCYLEENINIKRTTIMYHIWRTYPEQIPQSTFLYIRRNITIQTCIA